MAAIRTDEAVGELKTIKDLLRWTMSRFSEANLYYGHGTDNPWDEALQLILPTLALPLDIPEVLFDSVVVTSEKITIIKRVLGRIEERIPVAYLTNKAWFCGHEFFVDERVLIPRSPIGELITNQFTGIISSTPNMILDLCTGSGCIAIACAYEFPEAQVDAVDISAECLEVAERNIYSHHLENRVFPIRSDLFNALPQGQYDLIVSNPPYVDAEDMQDLPAEYHKEPRLALAAGEDGLHLVTRLLYEAPDYLTEQGVLICEVGNSQVHLMERYRHIPFTWLEFEWGGDGVFLLSRTELLRYRDDFKENLQ